MGEILAVIADRPGEQGTRLCAECLAVLPVSGAGVHAIFAFPLRVGAIRVGVLDLRDHGEHGDEDPALAGPIESQAKIHQATGMITIQLGVSLAEALLRLRAHAYATGRTVSAVAAEVVGRRLLFDDSEPGTTTQRDPS